MTIFGEKNLGVDIDSGLQKKLLIWDIQINGKTEVITCKYDISLISPTGMIVKTISTNNYKRFNKLAELDEDGITVISPANLKWDSLKNSIIGQGILSMIAQDVVNYPNLEQN